MSNQDKVKELARELYDNATSACGCYVATERTLREGLKELLEAAENFLSYRPYSIRNSEEGLRLKAALDGWVERK